MNSFQLKSKNPKTQDWGLVSDMCNESPRIQLLHFLSWECSCLAQSAYHDKYITSLDNFCLSASRSSQGAQNWLLKRKNMCLWLPVTLIGRRDSLTAARLRLLAAWINRLMFFSLFLFSHCWGEETNVFQLWQFAILRYNVCFDFFIHPRWLYREQGV